MPAPPRLPAGARTIVAVLALTLGGVPSEPLAPEKVLGAEPSAIEPADVLVRWEREVRPLLAEHCLGCHGPAKRESGLSLSSIADVIDGGDRGPAIQPVDAGASLLGDVIAVDGDPHMPPDGQLDQEAIALIQSWARDAASLDLDALRQLANQPDPRPANAAWASYPPGIDPALVVDVAIQEKWPAGPREFTPAPRCDDRTFVRRLYLDLIGRIPTAEERAAFLAETDSRKRERLIDHLLASPEHARHMAELFDTILMGREKPRTMERREKHGWIDFLTTAFAENRPWDEVARQVLLARPESPEEAGATWYLFERDDEHQQIAESVSRGIFGLQIQCAQCHDHPMAAEIKQAHYWGLVAFFNRGENTQSPHGPRVAESAVGGFSMFTNLSGESQPNRLVFLGADLVDEPRPADGEKQEDRDELYIEGPEGTPRIPRFSRRQQFVDRVLADHPLVARAMVNRLWALMMGRGLVHPVDQLDSVHPPSHPRLLDWLAEDFERGGYDVRRMLRQLALSRTYQLSSESDTFVDPSLFAVAAIKPLTAEALYRSMLVALRIEIPEPLDARGTIAEFREAFPDLLAPESVSTVRQALLLTNGPSLNDMLTAERSPTIAEMITMDDPRAVVDAGFERVLGRGATDEEAQRAVEFLQARSDRPLRGVDHFVWTLLSSAEFRFNH